MPKSMMSPKDKLTAKQRALVDALVTTGCTITKGAEIADRVGIRAPDKVQHSVSGELSIKIDLD